MTFSILFVCTGNICRSPTAERLLRHALRARLGGNARAFTVTSAGTGALVGQPIQEHAAALLTGNGVDVEQFAARQLDATLLEGADLVIAMTREHRAWTARTAPGVVPRLFTLRELARLSAATADRLPVTGKPADRARALVQAAAAQRGALRPDHPRDDDVPDPYGRPASAYRKPFELISAAVDTIAQVLVSDGWAGDDADDERVATAYRHLVLFRVYDGVADATVDGAIRHMRDVIGRTAGVVSARVERSLDVRKGVVIVEDVTFASRDAFEAYRTSKAHDDLGSLMSGVGDWLVGDYLA
jgi:protein-tyrosine phosphatase